MEKENKTKELLKRNNQAPNFPTNIIKSRAELLVEMFVQKMEFDLQEYIEAQRIFKINIPTKILKEWYPTPNWKKDVTSMVNQLRNVSRFEKGANGSFKYYSLISFSQFSDEEGLQLNSDPEALKSFIVDSKTSYTLLDYELTNKFKCVYSHQIYWLICKHDNAYHRYQLYLTPSEINEMFETHYQCSDIKKYIFTPVKKELKKLFDTGYTTRDFTIEDDWQVIGRKKQITGWFIKIQNTDRIERVDLMAIENLHAIETIIQKYLPKKKANISQQLHVAKSETILALYTRLVEFEKSDKSHIANIPGYVCKILEAYQISPNKKVNISSEQISSSPLFEKQEKDTAFGLDRWLQCREYWKSTDIPEEAKIALSELRYYSYTENLEEEKLTLSVPSETLYATIEEKFIDILRKTIHKFYSNSTSLFYNIQPHD